MTLFKKRSHVTFNQNVDRLTKKKYGFLFNSLFSGISALVHPTEKKIFLKTESKTDTKKVLKNIIETIDKQFYEDLNSNENNTVVKSNQMVNNVINVISSDEIIIDENIVQKIDTTIFQNIDIDKLSTSTSNVLKTLTENIASEITNLIDSKLNLKTLTDHEKSVLNLLLGSVPVSGVNSQNLENNQDTKALIENFSKKTHESLKSNISKNSELTNFLTEFKQNINTSYNIASNDKVKLNIDNKQIFLNVQSQIKKFNITSKVFNILNQSSLFIVEDKIMNEFKIQNSDNMIIKEKNEKLQPLVDTVGKNVNNLAATVISPINNLFIVIGIFGVLLFCLLFVNTSDNKTNDASENNGKTEYQEI
jgi:ATP-dependent 26S proteasome regulatory subunit